MKFIIFEDDLHNNFYPLSITKPLWELKTGLFSFRERMINFIHNKYNADEENIFLFTREELVPYLREQYSIYSINEWEVFDTTDEEFVFINATAYPANTDVELLSDTAYLVNGHPLVARMKGELLGKGDSISEKINNSNIKKNESENVQVECGLSKADYIWDLIIINKSMIIEDYKVYDPINEDKKYNDVTFLGDRSQISIDEDVVIDPYVVIDARRGPVVIESETEIQPFTRIEGPAYIGEKCTILGAKIREGCSIGDCCRIGGEVEETIFHGYSNKYHDGFIGHSYIGEWINMGALTTNSDLKNNYTDIKVYVPKKRKNTGSNKIGCFMGDFVKTSIGTLINTGCSIGPGAMVVHAGKVTPYHIGPFSWYMENRVESFDWCDEFISSTKIMMGRRDRKMSDTYKDLLKKIFKEHLNLKK